MEDWTRTGQVTRLLRSWADGDQASLNAVIPIVYDELRSIARRQLSGRGIHHLQTTVLVHEAYEKLVTASEPAFNDRRHFFAVAARAMRQIVIDGYRSRMAAKRGGQARDFEVKTYDLVDQDQPEKVLQLSEAIDRMSAGNPELAEVLELSCFAGLSNDEIAELHGTTLRTVQRKLVRAKAWVHNLLTG